MANNDLFSRSQAVIYICAAFLLAYKKRPTGGSHVRAVLPAVLSAAIVLFGTNTSTAEETQTMQPIQAADPDVARLLALVNTQPVQREVADLRHVFVRIGKDGKAKAVEVAGKSTDASSKQIEKLIKSASFSTKEKKIKLTFVASSRR
jgi:hypothetical protein